MTASILMSGVGMMPASSISPERLEAIERLGRLQSQLDLLQLRIRRVEEGCEPEDGSSLTMLHMRLDGLLEDLERQRRRASGQCCNCGGGCRG